MSNLPEPSLMMMVLMLEAFATFYACGIVDMVATLLTVAVSELSGNAAAETAVVMGKWILITVRCG